MASSKLTIAVDRKLCIGAAACVGSAPELFNLDEDNVAYVVTPGGGEAQTATVELSEAEQKQVREAAENCPTGAITVTPA